MFNLWKLRLNTKNLKNFTELYEFMSESHLEEISVTIKYPDKQKVLELCQLIWFYHLRALKKSRL